jgi:hypothetical protein
MKRLLIITALCSSALAATLASAGPLRADHPLIGTWKVTFPDGTCEETYLVRPNGTTFVTSAEEVAESKFELSDKPSEKGFYKWVDTITKDNGKKDCSGEVTQVGHAVTNYIRLHPSGEMCLLCEKEDIDTCIGPFVRVKGTGI